MGFAGFTDGELKVIALRTNGVNMTDIGIRLGIHRDTARKTLARVYSKLPFTDLALLTRWAMEHELDKPLDPETAETRPHPGRRRNRECSG